MCGRFTMSYHDWPEIMRYYGAKNDFFYEPRFNIAPSQDIPAIIAAPAGRRAGLLRWGLIPSWAEREDTQYSTINARVETLLVKPAFRNLISSRRVAIVADGWYEWRKSDKQPYRIITKRNFFTLAGLYDIWESRDGRKISSCTIITCEPSSSISSLHNRMPVVLTPRNEDIWLDPAVQNTDTLIEILQPYPDEELTAYPVSKIVGDVKNDYSLCIHPESQ